MKKTIAVLVTAAVFALNLTGCGSDTSKAVAVQSVAMLAGLTDIMQHQQFVGVVSTGKEESIEKDSSRKVSKVYVKVNDVVEQGDVLFEYDAQDIQDTIETEKLQLEIDRANLESEKQSLEDLKKQKEKDNSDRQLEYALSIREAELNIREKEYNISKKEKEIQTMESSVTDLEVTAPFGGRITKAGVADTAGTTTEEGEETDGMNMSDDMSGESDDSSDNAFIKIVEMDNYRIKGTLNEQNKGSFSEGDSMIIYSRRDSSQTWSGEVEKIDYKTPQSDEGAGVYGDEGDETTNTSKYTFYVEITDLDGLMIGQHVYMRVDDGTPDPDGKIRLDASFIEDAGGDSPWIWAEDNAGKLEKRAVSLGEFDEDANTWVIEKGLDEMDFITLPSDDCAVGAPCRENTEDAFEDASGDAGEEEDVLADENGEEEFDETYDETYGEEEFDETYDETYGEGEEYDETYADEEYDEAYDEGEYDETYDEAYGDAENFGDTADGNIGGLVG